ncbi:MAG: hypothetical protein HQ515_00865, partial [Phycisphaeraceae bacterium]|nr:hypothetical protein [Phycisphaeraceae bacterium]
NVIAVVALFIHWSSMKPIIRKVIGYYILGFLIAVTCLTIQLILMRDLPTVDAAIQKEFLCNFIEYWGRHRMPLYESWVSNGPIQNRLGHIYCAFSLVVLIILRRQCKPNILAQYVISVIFLNGLLGALLGISTHLSPDQYPMFLSMLMPGRYINLNNALLVPLLLCSLFLRYNRMGDVTSYKLYATFLILSVFARHYEVMLFAYTGLICCLVMLSRNNQARGAVPSGGPNGSISFEKMIGIFLCCFIFINLFSVRFESRFRDKTNSLWDKSSEAFYTSIAARPGMLLVTSDFPRMQLKTRRPVLADMSAANFLTYATESALVFSHVLSRAYGVDLAVPPPENLLHQDIISDIYRDEWEGRTLEEWRLLGEEFDLKDVVTKPGWQLNLPSVFRSDEGILYTIPPRSGVKNQ